MAITILLAYLRQIPAIHTPLAAGEYTPGRWWVKFRIDVTHPLAWQVVQELACVVNYISIEERLPTRFYPISPAPYLNGGPQDYLSWIVENTDEDFRPADLAEWLEGRLPRPVADLRQWAE